MSSPAPPPYERGDALAEAFSSAEPEGDQSTPPRDLEKETLYNLSRNQYWTWLEAVVENGGALDAHLDDVLDDVYDCQPAFYEWQGRRALESLLDELHAARESVRAYEQDVEQIRVAFARTDIVETQAADNAEMVLAQIKDTYNRAYDLCLYRLDRMSDSWITATNLLISLTILVVTILFWMEFR